MKYRNGKPLSKCFGVLYDINDKLIYAGLLINGIPEEVKDIIIYDEKNNILYKRDIIYFEFNGNKMLYKNYICNEQKIIIDIINTLKINEISFLIKVFFVSYCSPGKTALITRLVENRWDDSFIPMINGIKDTPFVFEYNKIKFKLNLSEIGWHGYYDTKYFLKGFIWGEVIIIFTFDLSNDDLDELYLNEIIANVNSFEKIVYLVGNQCDNIKCKNILFNNREKAKKLIERGIINKYFEVSAKTGEGIYELLNILKIDSILSYFKIKM